MCAEAAFQDVDSVRNVARLYNSCGSSASLAEHASYALHWSLALLVVKLLKVDWVRSGCHAFDEAIARQAAVGVQPLQNRSKKQAAQQLSDAAALPGDFQEAVRMQQELVRDTREDLGEGYIPLALQHCVEGRLTLVLYIAPGMSIFPQSAALVVSCSLFMAFLVPSPTFCITCPQELGAFCFVGPRHVQLLVCRKQYIERTCSKC